VTRWLLLAEHFNLPSGMASDTPFLHSVSSSLPTDFTAKLEALCKDSPSSEPVLDTLIRFIVGAECPFNSPSEMRDQWSDKQRIARKTLNDLMRLPENKRRREDGDISESDSQSAKRQKLPSSSGTQTEHQSTDDDAPTFTLHSISTTSPVRKKVDIAVHKSSIRFINPSTHAVESIVALSSIIRAFILPTRGKQKPHWTIVLLSSDIPDRGKASSTFTASNPQIIFGLDALAPTPLTTTAYPSPSKSSIHVIAKGSETLPSLRDFLSHLGIPILEPTTEVFRSACAGAGSSAGNGGIPGIEAYRAAKQGNLWFMKEGILWGEGKPCEFWSVEDLIGKSEGLRMVSATGRTCTIILTRKSDAEVDGEIGEDEEDVGVETEFTLVDAREQDGISQWVRQHRHLFGKKRVVIVNGQTGGSGSGNAVTINNVEDDSDEDDEDFEVDSEDEDGGSASSDSSEESGDNRDGGDAEESGEGSESEDGGGVEDEELKAENHPLMRPGAMPRISRAAIDMVVGMVEEDLMGPGRGRGEDEEDELED